MTSTDYLLRHLQKSNNNYEVNYIVKKAPSLTYILLHHHSLEPQIVLLKLI